jgi:hypothetical protein
VTVSSEDGADELYLVVPGEFVARRSDAVRAARAAGDRDRAAVLSQLRKPTVSAWALNQLARTQPRSVHELLDLGDELRAATAAGDGPALRELARRRQQRLADVVALARRVAVEHGQQFGDSAVRELETTLTAAVADPRAAEQVLSGRLTGGLAFAGLGFDEGGLPPERALLAPSRERPAPRPSSDPTTSTPSERADIAGAVGRREAQRILGELRSERDSARRALEKAKGAVADAEASELLAAAEHARAVESLAAARATVDAASETYDAAERALASETTSGGALP